MAQCYFVSDLHGRTERYDKLYSRLLKHPPDALFIGGDILPHGYHIGRKKPGDFIQDELVRRFLHLKEKLGKRYPRVFLIMGNDDPRINEERIIQLGEKYDIWEYAHGRHLQFGSFDIYGYSFIPPSPFGLKDWEKYDVSRFADPGCTHPIQGIRTVEPDYDPEYSNIKKDLEALVGERDVSQSVFLFHSPPYDTSLDRADLDGKMVDYVPMDVHVGSIAMQRFIKERKPLLTLHGHIHEASSITGEWRIKLGDTHAFNASYHEKERLAIVEFDLNRLDKAKRKIL